MSRPIVKTSSAINLESLEIGVKGLKSAIRPSSASAPPRLTGLPISRMRTPRNITVVKAVVQLQTRSDRSSIAPDRPACSATTWPIQLHADHLRARLDLQFVPVVLLQEIALGILESINAAGGMRIGKRLLIWIS